MRRKCFLKEKDVSRMKDLIKIIGCKVIRYNEPKKEIKEYYVL